MNLLLLLLHHRQQRDLFLARVIAGHAVVLLFLLADLAGDRERVNVDGYGVVEEPETGETLDDSRIRRARPAGQHDDGMVMAVEVKTEVRLPAAFGVPAIFMDGQFLDEAV